MKFHSSGLIRGRLFPSVPLTIPYFLEAYLFFDGVNHLGSALMISAAFPFFAENLAHLPKLDGELL